MPIGLAAQWGVWFAVGLGLSIWGRREKAHGYAYDYADAHSHAHADAHAAPPVEAVKPKAVERQPRPATAPHASGDAFGELEALLEPFAGSHRMPGEAPSAPAAAAAPAPESPVLREAPRLAAPQSLP